MPIRLGLIMSVIIERTGKEDKCPKCNSTNCTFGPVYFEEDLTELNYDGECLDCGCEFVEIHSIQYKHSQYYSK